MNRLLISSLAATACISVASGQRDPGIPLLTPEERAAVDAQSEAFSNAIQPALKNASASTVRIWSGTQRLAYGTAVGNGTRIITKWSELLRARGEWLVEAAKQDIRPANLLGVYPDYDLALLEIPGDPLPPAEFSDQTPELGAFLAAPQPDGRLAAFGVVAVAARNLKEADQAFIGIAADPDHTGDGVKIGRVVENSPAAAAGIQSGDIILSINERDVNGWFELRNALSGIQPGNSLSMTYQQAGQTITREIQAAGRPQFPQFPGARLQQMERMGGPISRIRDEFPIAIESDMRPLPNQIGGPVVDLQGRIIGITLARAGRTKSYIIPATTLNALLDTMPESVETASERIANLRRDRSRQNPLIPDAPDLMPSPRVAPGRGNPPDPNRLDRHLTDMQRLLDLMRQEMKALER